jgi:hypothetical protein
VKENEKDRILSKIISSLKKHQKCKRKHLINQKEVSCIDFLLEETKINKLRTTY